MAVKLHRELQSAKNSLGAQPELYFEAGDHEHLVRLRSGDLFRLLSVSGARVLRAPSAMQGASYSLDIAITPVSSWRTVP